jgi:demethylmenaquinone methyltransferase / 2-methoxy-6-polyprenyl-1,4-benzoquinol methylase
MPVAKGCNWKCRSTRLWKSGRGLPQFRTFRVFVSRWQTLRVLDCGSPLPLLTTARDALTAASASPVAKAWFDDVIGFHARWRRMSDSYYAPGEQRAQKVNDLFGKIARRYDLINDVQSFGLHRRWKRRVVELASVRPENRALDVCCGTGDIAFALAARGAEVVGLDFSGPMLEVAENRKRKAESGKRETDAQSPKSKVQSPKFLRGDAQQIPFPDGSFDIVTVGYGLRNLASWEIGMGEMVRVARPGARLVVLDFGKPPNAAWRAIYFCYLKLAVPLLGLVFCGNVAAYAYILESLKHYPAQLGVAARMRELGLVNVCIVNLLGGAMSINYGEKPK